MRHYEKDFQQVVLNGAKEGGQSWADFNAQRQVEAEQSDTLADTAFTDAANQISDTMAERGFKPLNDQVPEPDLWEMNSPSAASTTGMDDNVGGFAERADYYTRGLS